jgi:short-subunit dehydrogenase
MRILVIGGTSGIGWALAEHYLNAGHDVAVCGRNIGKLKSEVTNKYTKLKKYALDITDKGMLISVVDDYARDTLDLVIVCAGFYFNNRHHTLDESTTLSMLQTNISGMNDTFLLCSKKMLQQKSGRLVAIASVAGLLKHYPSASLYSQTKRSVIQLCDAYRVALAPFTIAVTTIIPGYIDTEKLRELNQGDASKKPFLMREAQAVEKIVSAISNRKPIAIFPWQMRGVIFLMNLLPKWLLAIRF